MASWKCCPHVDASLRSGDDLKCRKAFFYYGTDPGPDDDPTPPEKVQPWVDMMNELLLETQLPASVINTIMRVCVPNKHHDALKPIAEDAAPAATDKLPTSFHRFPDLPAELRVTIWDLAATQPRRILPWGKYLNYDGKLPLNVPKHMPRVAQTCKEAWDAVNATGGYCEPYDRDAYDMWRDEKKPPSGVWASHDDLVYLPGASKRKSRLFNLDRLLNLDFFAARKELAVEYNEFVLLGPSMKLYRFLRDAQRLKTLVFIMDVQDININVHFRGIPHRLQKLVLHEDTHEMEKLDELWQGLGPEAVWIWRRVYDLLRANSAIYAPWMVSRCMLCETQLWKDEYVPRIKSAWLRIMCAEDPEIRNDPDIFPDGGLEPNEKHPWVQEELAKMPELKPAILLNFGERHPGDDAPPDMWNSLRHWAEHPENIK
jgi:hypothetical protein